MKVIPMNVEAFAVVAQLAADPAPGGFLFRNRNGHNLSGQRAAFHLAMQRVGIVGFRFHDFRHTFASRVRSHTDAFTVRDLLGHADIKETNIYTNPQFDEMRRAVEALSSNRVQGRVLEFRTG